jgi:hypothetical protein
MVSCCKSFSCGSEESYPVGGRREGVIAFSLMLNWLQHETSHLPPCGVRVKMCCPYYVIVVSSRDRFILFSLIMSHFCGSFWKIWICFTMKMNVHDKTILSACPLIFILYVDCLQYIILSVVSFPFPDF